jgi:mono/diheme cytochrome c family protein
MPARLRAQRSGEASPTPGWRRGLHDSSVRLQADYRIESRRDATVLAWISVAVLAVFAAQQVTVWDGVFTREQADRGEKLYADRCARCHGDTLQGV